MSTTSVKSITNDGGGGGEVEASVAITASQRQPLLASAFGSINNAVTGTAVTRQPELSPAIGASFARQLNVSDGPMAVPPPMQLCSADPTPPATAAAVAAAGAAVGVAILPQDPPLVVPEPQRPLMNAFSVAQTTPTLQSTPDIEAAAASRPSAPVVEERVSRSIVKEAKQLTFMSIPISLSFFIDNAAATITLFFLGHMGAAELAAGSLGLTLCNTTGWTLGSGMLSALDTQAAHAFGAGKNKRVGLITQRAFWIITLYCLPVSLVWLFAEQILCALQQDPEISMLAGKFVLWMLPGLLAGMWFEVARRYLQAIGVVTPTMIVVLVSLPISALYLFVLIQIFDLGLIGCPLAVSMVYWTQLLMLLAYIMGRRHLHAFWPGWTKKAFGLKSWWRFLKLAIPGALMGGMEGWGFDIMSIFAGWLGTVELAVHSALINTYYLLYMVPLGVSVATTTRVGTLLGSRNVKQSKISWYLSTILCIFFQILVAVGMIFARYPIASMFCTDPDVIELFVRMLPLMCIIMIIDGAQISAAGALRGIGKQKLGMIANFISFYVVGIPASYAMTFFLKQGLLGIWLGIGVCDTLSGAVFECALFFANWNKAMQEIAEEEARNAAAGAAAGTGEQSSLTPPVHTPNTYGSTAPSPSIHIGDGKDNEQADEKADLIEEEEEDDTAEGPTRRHPKGEDDESEEDEEEEEQEEGEEGKEEDEEEDEQEEEQEASEEKERTSEDEPSSEQISETEDESDEKEHESDESSGEEEKKAAHKKLLSSSSRVKPKDLPPPLPSTLQPDDY